MIKKICFLLLALFPLYSIAQKNIPLGMGMLKIDYRQVSVFELYTDTNNVSPAQTIQIIKNQSEEYSIENQDSNDWFKPEQLFFEYDIFLVRVDTVAGNWYKIQVNAATGATLWTRADAAKKFIPWKTFLLKEISSVDKGDYNLDIKAAPSDKATNIKKIETIDCFQVLEIKGDWMKIKTNKEMECSESKKPVSSGWIRWRQNNRLTINYSLTS
jgi:hypothetical protein